MTRSIFSVQCVICVSHHEKPGSQRYFISLQSVRVPLAVVAFVMSAHHVRCVLEKSDSFDDVVARLGVVVHLLPFHVSQSTAFQEDVVRHRYFVIEVRLGGRGIVSQGNDRCQCRQDDDFFSCVAWSVNRRLQIQKRCCKAPKAGLSGVGCTGGKPDMRLS
jgi:hypothetical protein